MLMYRILLVEDEEPIRNMIRFALSRVGMDMLEAVDVKQARQILEHQLPDLVLLDWMLPDESGLVFLAELRKEATRSQVPVIMLTARAEEENRVRGLESGADDYVTKPFSPKELIARINAVLRRSQPPGPSVSAPETRPEGHHPTALFRVGRIPTARRLPARGSRYP